MIVSGPDQHGMGRASHAAVRGEVCGKERLKQGRLLLKCSVGL